MLFVLVQLKYSVESMKFRANFLVYSAEARGLGQALGNLETTHRRRPGWNFGLVRRTRSNS
ncbi:hypothetical protein GUITHDRAFT_154232 [Guillardia theta CCMP2712]|uniref:Uncharacterized protein n=1 Tax=Guillardia theta (strain CCMP2712) TaxID=905079 RepID=L1IV19_GUITC|nr:hypothetical protein GUITHDRAFT_154232 [Guillardia theta CCMP2712]EKX40088.1 hypothetical protein GUITHDRAFT_154232 [Guillardia theta CCMP2712]|eukprot:XP_005827068.1 hypothetical protein GUITHDRAFT_154232 [Guillardia theta CCMP2712]